MKNCLDLLSDAYPMILDVNNVKRIYIITGRTDFRKGMLSLAAMVVNSKIKITKKVGIIITSFGNEKLS